MKNYDIKLLQSKLLNIFFEFKKICEENDLQYFAIGGTCLGAVRHQGFIPWDDDMDIGMPRKDYDKFREIAKKELPQPYELRGEFSGENRVDYFISRIYDSSTTLIHNYMKSYPDLFGGIYIDIMPLDSIPDSSRGRRKFFFKLKLIKFMDLRQKFELSYFAFSRKAKILAILFTPTKLFRKEYFMKKYLSIVKKFDFYDNDYSDFSFLWSSSMEKLIFEKKDFLTYKILEYEDTTIRCPKGADNYLSRQYGEYMLLPKKENRYPISQNEKVDLNNSYSNYVKGGVK